MPDARVNLPVLRFCEPTSPRCNSGPCPSASWRLRLWGSSPWLSSSTIASPAVRLGRERTNLNSDGFDAEPADRRPFFARLLAAGGQRRRGGCEAGGRRGADAGPPVPDPHHPADPAVAANVLDDSLCVALPGATGGGLGPVAARGAGDRRDDQSRQRRAPIATAALLTPSPASAARTRTRRG